MQKRCHEKGLSTLKGFKVANETIFCINLDNYENFTGVISNKKKVHLLNL